MTGNRRKIKIDYGADDQKFDWAEFIRERKKILIIALAILVVAVLIFAALQYFKKPITKIGELPKLIVQEGQEMNLMEGKAAVALALAEARKWQPDAELSYLISSDAGQLRGRSNNWQLIFVSQNIKDKGYQIKITDAKISVAQEISYIGSAAELPGDTISQAEAITQVKAIPGFADVKILGVDMIYNAAVKKWYWGVKTDKGTVTVMAAKTGQESKNNKY
jgi:hypothetical protein